jgi:hypothetical protein
MFNNHNNYVYNLLDIYFTLEMLFHVFMCESECFLFQYPYGKIDIHKVYPSFHRFCMFEI